MASVTSSLGCTFPQPVDNNGSHVVLQLGIEVCHTVCGLLGLLMSGATTTVGRVDAAAHCADRVDAAMHCLRHRGPDEHGTWYDDRLVLGFNRLSIIDIAHSHQPLRWGPADNPQRTH